jgi:hypothetical protein
MRRLGLLLAVCVVVALSVGCGAGYYRTPVQPAGGWLFARLEAPISTNYDAGAVVTMKSGSATSESFLGWIALGDASLTSAAKNGGISKIHYADYKFENILGVYSKFTTVVYGE